MVASSWYDHTADAGSIPVHVAERALEWLLDLQEGPASPELIEAFRRWRAEHPDHARAWQRIESVRSQLAPLASPVTADVARATLAPPPTTPRTLPRRRALKTLAVVTFAGGLTWAAQDRLPWRAWSADYRTGVGERRTLVLEDGTRLQMNTASAVDIHFDAQARRVRLLAGEILITTAKDPQPVARPFFVESAHGTARALGTRYAVRQRADDTEVSVFHGAVEIRPRDGAGPPRLVESGFGASFTVRDVTAPAPVEVSRAAWAEGFIVARSMRLDQFVDELNRYSREPVTCDPAVAALRVSGSFPLDDVRKVLSALSTTLDVRTEVTTRLWGQTSRRIVPARP